MKKLITILLVLAMVLALAPMAFASEEAVIDEAIIIDEPSEEEPAAEPEEPPALDGVDHLNAWIQNGKIYWDSYSGANEYIIHYKIPAGNNSTYSGLSAEDSPFDFAAYLESEGDASGTYTFYVRAGLRRANGAFEGLASSETIEYEFSSIYPTLETPEAWWDGTTIRWKSIDLSPYAAFGGTADNICVEIRLYEDGNVLTSNSGAGTGVPLSKQGTSWDASKYIEMPDRSYYFTIWFKKASGSSIKVNSSKTFKSESVTGQKLLEGYNSLAPKTITSVAVTGLDEPAVGKTGDTSVSVPGGAHYTASNVNWYKNGVTDKLTGSWTFEDGNTYYCQIDLAGKDGYVFSDKNPVTVNGKNWVIVGGKYIGDNLYSSIIIRGKFTMQQNQVISSVSLTDFDEPVIGKTGDTSISVPGGAHYTASNVRWYKNGVTDKLTGSWTFEAGNTYYCEINLAGKDGYVFSTDTPVTVNGKNWVIAGVSGSVGDKLYSSVIIRGKFTVEQSTVAEPLTLTFAADGKSAKVTGDWSGLYARVALVLDNNGVSGLYITQATINDDGTILVPEFKVPGLTVKGVNIAIVPTLADIQSSTPNAIVTATKMLNT